MADPYVRQAKGVFTGTVGSTAVKAGDAVYFDTTDWELADASQNSTYAEAIAINGYNSGDVGAFCRSCILVDIDSGAYTQGDQYYLSETAGAITVTRPTTVASLRQLLGFALSTNELYIDIPPVREHPLFYNFVSNQDEAAGSQVDSGNYIAAHMNADDEDVGATFAVPDNAVGLEIVQLYTLFEAVTGATDFDITVSAAADGEQHDFTTQDSTLASQVASGATADEIHRISVSTAFDAAGILESDNIIGFHAVYDGGQTDVGTVLGLQFVWLVV